MPRNAIVVGMPRSGTSLTAGIFARRGYYVGPMRTPRVREGDASNPFGYFEADDLVESNVAVLGRAGFPRHNTWLYEPISASAMARIPRLVPSAEDHRLIARYKSKSPWLWKDPRLCFTLPFWWSAMDKTATVVILVQRDPVDIYRSFVRKGWCPPDATSRRRVLRLAEQHMGAATEAVRAMEIPHLRIDFADCLSRPAWVARRIGERFDLRLSAADLNVRPELDHSRRWISTFLRVQLLKLPKDLRRRLKRSAPRRLVGLLFPEWRHVGAILRGDEGQGEETP